MLVFEIFTASEVPLVEGIRNPIEENLMKNLQGKWVERSEAESQRQQLYNLYRKLMKKKGLKGSANIPKSFEKMSLPQIKNELQRQVKSTANAKEHSSKIKK